MKQSMKGSRTAIILIVMGVLTPVLFAVDMMAGSVNLSPGDVWNALMGDSDAGTVQIVRHIRLIKAIVAVVVGISLSISGLQMQTLFRNPLAGPYVLGITSGASLGVAMMVLGGSAFGISISYLGSLGVAGAAWLGAALVLVIIAAVCVRIKDIMVILILGMMFSSGIGAIVQIMQYLSNDESLKTFVVWTMGSLGDVTVPQLWIMIPAVSVGLIVAVAAIKPMNLLMAGEQYAVSMGLDVRRARMLLFTSTVLLAGTVTAFCGPIGFIGLAVPHVARAIIKRADCRVLLPTTLLVGAQMMLVCDIISRMLALPINSVTALMGIPIVVWVVIRMQYDQA